MTLTGVGFLFFFISTHSLQIRKQNYIPAHSDALVGVTSNLDPSLKIFLCSAPEICVSTSLGHPQPFQAEQEFVGCIFNDSHSRNLYIKYNEHPLKRLFLMLKCALSTLITDFAKLFSSKATNYGHAIRFELHHIPEAKSIL